MLIEIQSRKISDSYSDAYEYRLLQRCGTLHLPTDLHGSNLCSVNGASNPHERFESVNIRVATGTHFVSFFSQLYCASSYYQSLYLPTDAQ
jgi:hypothetical protein